MRREVLKFLIKKKKKKYFDVSQVPKYLSQQWAKATGRGDVGKLRIAK